VYGAYLPPKAKQLENKQLGFQVHGFVEDAEQAIRSARVLLAPINFGAGIKGKLVDAMKCSTPSVTSPIGSEGLTIHRNKDANSSSWPGAICDISENSDHFINRAIALYQNETDWLESSQSCEPYLHALFDYAEQSKHLLEKLYQLLADLSQHRNKHFFGQVLQHHTTSSTKYMSQWIEAKSKLK
jgi:glycosyltransferase involved in cell wall biosynthesis